MATCTVKTIEDSEKVLVINNGVHINNPKNIEALRIIKYLHNEHIYYLKNHSLIFEELYHYTKNQ